MMMAAASDTLQLVTGMLLASITGFVMAGYHRDWAISVEAGMKYFLLGAFANSLLMVGVALLYGLLGTSSYAAMASATTIPPMTGRPSRRADGPSLRPAHRRSSGTSRTDTPMAAANSRPRSIGTR